MLRTLRHTLYTAALALLALLVAGPAPAATVQVFLKAVRTTKPLPGAPAPGVPVWAYSRCTSNTFVTCEDPTVPGPVIQVNVGDELSIRVQNDLGTPTSLLIPGQVEGGQPVMEGGRVRSLTREVAEALGSRRTYSWPTPLKAGTYIYQSGTHAPIQVPMGLYGAVVVSDPDASRFPGAAYDASSLLLFSEIDTVQNAAVAAAAAPANYPSTMEYNPKYFLVNGVAFDATSPNASALTVPAAGTLLLRLANAGLRSHIAAIPGLDLEVRAEDGNLYPTPRRHSAVLLPAGKTHDALATVENARVYAVYDRMLDLTNADAPYGGMLAYLRVGSGAPAVPPVGASGARDDAYEVAAGHGAFLRSAPGVLANDGVGLQAVALSSVPTAHGNVTLNVDGSFSYTPAAAFAGEDQFVYQATGGSSATVTLNVLANARPSARDDAYSNAFGDTLQVDAPGVLANDGDAEGDALFAVSIGSWGLDSSGSISSNTAGGQYRACEVASPTLEELTSRCSEPVNVVLSVNPVRGLSLNVVSGEPDGSTGAAVSDYRWIVEEDATWHPDPLTPGGSLGTNFHRSHMPVVAQGCAGAGCEGPLIDQLALDPQKHYYVSVLPRSAGSGNGHTNGGAPIPPGAMQVRVVVNRQPLPPAQITVFAFEDNAPTNGAPDGNEVGLGGFEIVVEDAGGRYGQNGGRMLTDKDGNLLTNAKAGTPGCPAAVASQVGVILTCPDGTAIIGNLAPGKYGISVVPPEGSTEGWTQTSTIEGSKVNDAWVKANEPAYFQEFGPPGYHVFTGFVSASRLAAQPLGSARGGNTVSGRVTNMHMSRPPAQTLYDAGTNDAMAHTTAWVGLNTEGGIGPNLAAVKAGPDGSFTIPGVGTGRYQLVVWDAYLDQIIAYRTLDVAGATNVGNVPVFQWFARLEHNVFRDTNQNGFKDLGEAPLIEQNVNIRFRDGSIYQSYPTDHDGFVPFDQVFPFFNWMVAEVDYARFKPTGVTVTVDDGGPLSDSNSVYSPQTQSGPDVDNVPTGNFPGAEDVDHNGNRQIDPSECSPAGCDSRTEKGPQLLQAFQGFLGQTSVIDWGKVPYQPGENGGISGVVYYASTRAENNPRLAAADPWEPGIPSVKVRLYREFTANDGSSRLVLVDEVETDSWDKSPPEDCPGDTSSMNFVNGQLGGNRTKCYDGMRNWNQVRPGVFDGGYAFTGISPGRYVVEVVPPPGFELVKEEDKNVDFGDAYGMVPAALGLPNLGMALALPDQALVADALAALEPQPGILQPPCAGEYREVPAQLSLFQDPVIEAPYATVARRLCDRKEVVLSDQMQAAADFFLFTSTPIASHFTGMILDDLSQEFNPDSPSFGEKWAPPSMPVSVRDWTGREISRLRSDKWGRINGLVPSTFTANVPSPSGYAPNMITTCMNDPGPISVAAEGGARSMLDPYYDLRYGNFCYTFQYMPGTTTYLDTPVLPTSAFAAGDPPVDCAFPTGTPVIRQADGDGIGPVVGTGPGHTLTLSSMGTTEVPNPDYEGPEATTCPETKPTCTQKTIARDHGFGTTEGQVTIGNLTVASSSVTWGPETIGVALPGSLTSAAGTHDVKVTRADTGRTSITGITLTVSSTSPVRVHPGESITAAIAAATTPPGALVLVEPGTYDELVIMAKPVQLQGSGPGSTFINAVKRPAEKLAAWRTAIDALVTSGAVDALPGQEFGTGGLEPDTLGTEEGAGITVLAAAGGTNRYRGRNARIDGFTITGGDTGGGIFVNGWAHDLQISNNRVTGNQGYFHGGIRVGRPFLEGLEDQQASYGFNEDVRIHSNAITQNGALEGAGGGGVAICTGTDDYQLFDNWICGNFSEGHGGGVAHFGRSDNGQILRNRILFNQSFNQGLTKSGGGLFVGGEPPAAGGLSLGAGRNLLVDANLIQGNLAGAGPGGGVRLERTSGADRARGCLVNGNNPGAPTRCYRVRMTNNMIVNNVAGAAGGGVSLLDAAWVEIVNNTIARNDSTATVGGLFRRPNPNVSDPQPAGLSSEPHGSALAAVLPGFSNPTLFNNILWQNRSMYYDQRTPPAQLLPDPAGIPFSADTCGTSRAWDLGVLSTNPAQVLNPQFSTLTALTQHGVNYAVAGNSATDPNLAQPYCNGPRSSRLFPEPTTGPVTDGVIQVAPALDEGGNWIDVRYGPISLTGNYHLADGTSSAVDNGATSVGTGSAQVGAPGGDFDGDSRPIGSAYDRGADERGGTTGPQGTVAFTSASLGTLAGGTLAFGSQTGDVSSIVTLSVSDASVTFGTLTVANTSGNRFGKGPDTCSGAIVPVGASCTVTINFNARNNTLRTGTLTVPHDGSGSPQVLALTGQ